MFAWTVWCSCVILHFSLQRGQAEQFLENNLLNDYEDDFDGLETGVWTERNESRSGTEVPTDSNRTPLGTSISTANNSSTSETNVWIDSNSSRLSTEVQSDDSSNVSEVAVTINNNVTRSETGFPTDNNVTRPETDLTTDLHTENSKTRASIDVRLTGINTTRIPETAVPDICQNSSCPDIVSLTTTVPEGKNVTLRCGSASGTAMLWWFRNATFLQQGVGEVILHIAYADRSYSGPYLCADDRGCCIVEHHVSVYNAPPYYYHLAVMGAVLAVGIPLCIFLSVRQSSRLDRYVRMFNDRDGEEKYLIL